MKRICVYGSLRKGEYNFDAFKRIYGKEIDYEKTSSVDGFTLHSLGSYPCVVRNKENGKVVVDVLNVSNDAYQDIRNMELGAGYNEELVNVDGEDLPIYTFDSCNQPVVDHGDWTKR